MSVAVVLLLALAIALLIAEAHIPSGVLGAFAIGSLILAGVLYREEGHDLPIVAIVAVALALAAFVWFASRKVLATYRSQPVRTGYEELNGATAEVRSPVDPEGQVFVGGSVWRARLAPGEAAAPVGGRVTIESVEGLTLIVRQANGSERGAGG
ncbi:MAG TPA: NfeD family protein [Solirubrobacterales bacterium]|nr:NfeD family protein [Solirubrobacterales bacterium]